VGIGAAVAGTATLDHLAPAAAALSLALLLLAGAQLSPRWLFWRLGLVALAALPFLLIVPFTLPGDGWDLGLIHVSEHGLLAGTALFCRALAIGAFALVLTGTTPVHEILAAGHKLKVPGVLVQIALLAYQYGFLLADEFRRLRVAMRTRGFRVRATRHSYRTLGHAMGALLVRGGGRAETVAAAMRCRGFDGTYRTLVNFRTTLPDVLGFMALLTATIALVLWDHC
jgi:cobalt/nickel transport system permease protein